MDVVDGIGALVWHAECKRLSTEKIMQLRPPADHYTIRMYHSLYLTSLLSLVDLTAELFGDDVLDDWERVLEGFGGYSGASNAAYIRELRNAVVHRAMDITDRGIVVAGQTCVVAPPEASHRTGRRGPYPAFAYLLRNVFAICDDAVGSLVLGRARGALEELESETEDELRKKLVEGIRSSAIIPSWAREMALANIDRVPLDGVVGHQARRLRELLGPGTPVGLFIEPEMG